MPEATPRTLAEKLDALFRAAGNPSLETVAHAIRQGGGPTISAAYLWLLRTGRKANPTLHHLTALAAHFGIPPASFFEDALTERVVGDVEGLAALREPEVRRLALRAAGLSPRSRRALADLADHLGAIAAG